jgi:ParB-like chromosome segregation protein Spo0J
MAFAHKPTEGSSEPAAEVPAQELEFHRFANLLPAMSPQEFEDLKKSIETVGLQEPITLYQGKILDGRNRYKACRDLGIAPQPVDAGVRNDQEAIDYVITRNLQRRNLTAGQKAVVAVNALPAISQVVQDERVKKIRDAIAAKRIDGKRANLPSSGEPEKKHGPRRQVRATAVVGDLFGVSATYVRYAEALKAKDEKLLDEVIQRGAPLYALYKRECPEETKGRGRPGRKPDLIHTPLSRLIRLVEEQREEMPDVFAKLTEAMAALDTVRAAQRQAQEAAAEGAGKPAASRNGRKAAKKATAAK